MHGLEHTLLVLQGMNYCRVRECVLCRVGTLVNKYINVG